MIRLNKIVFLLFLMVSLSVICQESNQEKNILKDLNAISQSVPSEMKMMIQHLQESKLNDEQIKIVLVTAELISKDLEVIPPANIMFLLKSETYKGILTNQYLKQGVLLQASTSVLKSAEAKVKKFNNIYSTFSKWLINSLIKDFDPFLEKNFINNYQNLKRTDYNAQLKVKRLNKVLKYHSAWLNAINQSTPEEFNSLCTNVIIDTFERISKKTYYFKAFFGSLEKGEPDQLFSIPKYKAKEQVKSAPIDDEKSLKDESLERKEKAQDDVKGLETDDLSGISSEIDKIGP